MRYQDAIVVDLKGNFMQSNRVCDILRKPSSVGVCQTASTAKDSGGIGDWDNSSMQLHILVSGRVQGVGFRDFARRSAEEFGIHGYAKNLANGGVEIVAEGAGTALDDFLDTLKNGPPAGRVDHVQIDQRDSSGEYTGFEIRF